MEYCLLFCRSWFEFDSKLSRHDAYPNTLEPFYVNHPALKNHKRIVYMVVKNKSSN